MKSRAAILVIANAIVVGIGGGAVWAGLAWANRQTSDPPGGSGPASGLQASGSSATPPASVPASGTPAAPGSTPASTPPPATDKGNDRTNELGWLVTLDGVGPVKIGVPVSKMLELGLLVPNPASEQVCDDVYRTADGFRMPDGRDGLGIQTVLQAKEKVDYVYVGSEAFRTAEGAHVGMSVAEVKARYGSKVTTEKDQYGEPMLVLREGKKVIVFQTYTTGGTGGTGNTVTVLMVERSDPGMVYSPDGC